MHLLVGRNFTLRSHTESNSHFVLHMLFQRRLKKTVSLREQRVCLKSETDRLSIGV